MPRTPHFLFSGGGVSDVHKSDVPQIDQVTGSVRSGVRPNQSDHITSLPYRRGRLVQRVLSCELPAPAKWDDVGWRKHTSSTHPLGKEYKLKPRVRLTQVYQPHDAGPKDLNVTGGY